MSNIVLKSVSEEQLMRIEQVVDTCNLTKLGRVGVFTRAIHLAQGVTSLREMVDDAVMDHVMSLMNTEIGFKTDKDPARPAWNSQTNSWERPSPYPREVVKECFIQAILWGAMPVGNEFNIIASNTYLTKQYYMRAVGAIEGVTDVKNSPGAPMMNADASAAKIRVAVTWRLNGKHDQLLDCEGKPGRVFEIKVNKRMGVDAIVGKALRKAYHAAFMQITGSSLMPPEGDAGDVIDVTASSARSEPTEPHGPKAQTLADRLKTEGSVGTGPQDAGSPATAANEPASNAADTSAPFDTDPPAGAPASQPGAKTPEQRVTAAEAQGRANVDAKLGQQTGPKKGTAWDDFCAKAEEIAKAQKLSPEAFDSGLQRFKVGNGWVKREKDADPAKLDAALQAMRDGRFDWEKGFARKAPASK